MNSTDFDIISDNELNVFEERYTFEMQTVLFLKYMYVLMYSTTMILGIPLNLLVIITLLCKKRSREATWFLGLAFVDLLLCFFLMLYIWTALNDFNWYFGSIVCKLSSYMIFLNMHTTALILSFMGIEQCIPVRCRKICCTKLVCESCVLVCYTLACILSIPSLLYRQVQYRKEGCLCRDSYEKNEDKVPILLARATFGFFLCLFVTGIGYCVRSKAELVSNPSMKKFSQIWMVVAVAFCLCWFPYHLLMILQLNSEIASNTKLFKIGLPVANVLAAFNSCINPIIYILIGKSIKLPWMMSNRNSESPNETPDEHLELQPE